jgi:hypothetical protein
LCKIVRHQFIMMSSSPYNGFTKPMKSEGINFVP